MAWKGSKKSSVLIKWKTQDQWGDTQQHIARKNIKPADGPLKKDQSVKVKFNRSWYPAEICEEWTGEKEHQSKKVELCKVLPTFFFWPHELNGFGGCIL